MRCFALAALALAACRPAAPEERYGFVARLGSDTVSVESVTRRGSTVTSDAVDRFPRVRRRHTRIEIGPDGGIRRLVMDIHAPSEPAGQRERRVVAEVTGDSVRVTRQAARERPCVPSRPPAGWPWRTSRRCTACTSCTSPPR